MTLIIFEECPIDIKLLIGLFSLSYCEEIKVFKAGIALHI